MNSKTNRECLDDAAREHGFDPSGIADRDLALAMITAAGQDIDAPYRLGSGVRIADAPTQHLLRRAAILADDVGSPTHAPSAKLEHRTFTPSAAVRWLQRSGATVTMSEFLSDLDAGLIESGTYQDGQRFRVEALDAYRALIAGAR